MTLSSVGRRNLTVNVELQTRDYEGISVSAKICETLSGWDIEIKPESGVEAGCKRSRTAIVRLCEIDVANIYALRLGRSVQKSIPRQHSPQGGPYSATDLIIPLLLPLKIEDTLFPYQRQGVAWLLLHKRALLGDDMGLGKTAQALAAVRRLIRYGKIASVLVVAPRTLVANWKSEARRFAPELTVAIALPHSKDRKDQWSRLVQKAHVVLTSYEQLRDPEKVLIDHPPDLIIADEAHRLRKKDSLSTQGIRKIKPERFWALSGTPVEKDTEDLAVLLSLIDPYRFAPDDKNLSPITLRACLRPYLLRRHKDSVLSELPEVIQHDEVLDLTSEQEEAYSTVIRDFAKQGSQIGILPLFNELRSICDLHSESGSSSKLDRICDLLSDIRANSEKAVVFSYQLEPLSQLGDRLKMLCKPIRFEMLMGNMSLQERIEAINSFKTDSQCHVLLASSRVASEGITLTEANHVIFINRWWNPSSNAQARDRGVRIGQTRLVNVRTFTCRGTVEERLEQLLSEKSMTFEQLIESLSESPNDEHFQSLFH